MQSQSHILFYFWSDCAWFGVLPFVWFVWIFALRGTALSALWWVIGWFMEFRLLQWELESWGVIALLCLCSPPWVFCFKERKQIHFCLRCFYHSLEIKSTSTTYLSSCLQAFTRNSSKYLCKNVMIFLVKELQGEDLVCEYTCCRLEPFFSLCYQRPLNYFTMSNVWYKF